MAISALIYLIKPASSVNESERVYSIFDLGLEYSCCNASPSETPMLGK